MQRVDIQPTTLRLAAARHLRQAGMLILLIVAVVVVAYTVHGRYQASRLADAVERAFELHRYDEARGLLPGWIRKQPGSAMAQYYRARLALIDDQPGEAVTALELARKLGLRQDLFKPLAAIYQARAGDINAAEPVLRAAFESKQEPSIEIARELARIYLTTYRLPQATEVIERWRSLAPQDPQPYLWTNEVATRSDAEPEILIQNYRAALDRDPDLDKARLGLADRLSRARRFDEAEQEYLAYLKRKPDDVSALVGLGRNAFQNGDMDGAAKYLETALKIDPRQPEVLKELAQNDLSRGRFTQACRRFELLTQIEPYDHEIRYSFAQSLKLAGDVARSRTESELASRLRKEHDQILKLRLKILSDPNDMESRFAVAQWMLDHGHIEEGLKWTKEILRSDPGHVPTHRLLTNYYQKHGDAGLANYHRLRAAGP